MNKDDSKKKNAAHVSVEGKKDELANACVDHSKLADERLTQLVYLQADFDNLKKQFAKEKEDYLKQANENLIRSLLSVLDSFDKALETEKSDGIKKLYQQFFQVLEKSGLKKIKSSGEVFDPYYHEALIKEKSDKKPGAILEELQPGYLLNSKVIRQSKVKISGGNNHGG